MNNVDYKQCYCNECLYACTSPFGNLMCRKDGMKFVDWWQPACKENFKYRYDVIENENE